MGTLLKFNGYELSRYKYERYSTYISKIARLYSASDKHIYPFHWYSIPSVFPQI